MRETVPAEMSEEEKGVPETWRERLGGKGPVMFQDMIGKVMVAVYQTNNEKLVFVEKGGRHIFDHDQNCCESVYIDDICGDLSDLVGWPIIEAEEVSNYEGPVPADNKYEYSYTWTFYRFATMNGCVTVRWFGSSNGYYSESVSYSQERL